MYFIIYHSKAPVAIDKEVSERIALASDKNNASKNISGMLLAWEDNYIQYLESTEQKALEDLFETIKNDKRHTVKVYFKGETENRIFGKWTMGSWHMNPDEIGGLGGVKDLMAVLYGDNKNVPPSSEHFLKFMNSILDNWIATK